MTSGEGCVGDQRAPRVAVGGMGLRRAYLNLQEVLRRAVQLLVGLSSGVGERLHCAGQLPSAGGSQFDDCVRGGYRRLCGCLRGLSRG